jgi:hypothetical protein
LPAGQAIIPEIYSFLSETSVSCVGASLGGIWHDLCGEGRNTGTDNRQRQLFRIARV